MERVAHQTIVMQYIMELASQLKVDPRSCVGGFFQRYTHIHCSGLYAPSLCEIMALIFLEDILCDLFCCSVLSKPLLLSLK